MMRQIIIISKIQFADSELPTPNSLSGRKRETEKKEKEVEKKYKEKESLTKREWKLENSESQSGNTKVGKQEKRKREK